MRYFYTIGRLNDALYELRFPDFIGAREIFSCEKDAHQDAMSIFLEAVQARFEYKQRIPEPSHVENHQGSVNVPDTFLELIIQHNLNVERLNA